MFSLKFDISKVTEWSSRYDYMDDMDIIQIGQKVKEDGYFAQEDFLKICRWKSPRTQNHTRQNSEEYIRIITEVALSTSDERLRIEILTLLKGVDWPTASVLLHFGHTDRYPILDFRALWSLNSNVPRKGYNFDFWFEYVSYCRNLADKCEVDMRTLDQALWAYSKVNQ
ncbi:hypothetical protein [Robertmurraya sp.]|uniref:hypothetical protein n=1 Tax=Robertmurraya sp. TaxID=2837525 RepID=UPI003704C7E1